MAQIDVIAMNIKKFLVEMKISWRDTPILEIFAAIEEELGRLKRFGMYLLKNRLKNSIEQDPAQVARLQIRQWKNDNDVRGEWKPFVSPEIEEEIKALYAST